MKYAALKLNDIANAPGVAVSVYLQGCPHRCFNCFNPETWDFQGGQEFTQGTLDSIIEGLQTNGIKRSLCVLGGEPLCPENEFLTYLIVSEVKKQLPEAPVYIWTGYLLENLQKRDEKISQILSLADYLIDGPYVDSQRDITLAMKGSKNQRIWDLRAGKVIG